MFCFKNNFKQGSYETYVIWQWMFSWEKYTFLLLFLRLSVSLLLIWYKCKLKIRSRVKKILAHKHFKHVRFWRKPRFQSEFVGAIVLAYNCDLISQCRDFEAYQNELRFFIHLWIIYWKFPHRKMVPQLLVTNFIIFLSFLLIHGIKFHLNDITQKIHMCFFFQFIKIGYGNITLF